MCARAAPCATTSRSRCGFCFHRRYVDTPHYIGALSILRESDVVKANLEGCSVVGGLDKYRELLEHRSYLDYSSILETAVDVLTTDQGLRERLATRIKYVIVDEYQDVNPIQEAIVWSLHELGARICVVGDDDQPMARQRRSEHSEVQGSLSSRRADPDRRELQVKRRRCPDRAPFHRAEHCATTESDEADWRAALNTSRGSQGSRSRTSSPRDSSSRSRLSSERGSSNTEISSSNDASPCVATFGG